MEAQSMSSTHSDTSCSRSSRQKCQYRKMERLHLEEKDLCLLLGRKVMTNLDSIFKNIDITLPTKVRLVKAMVFPVVMYGCESWTVKKAEHQRIDAFELGVAEDS